jgi:branched-chain amino acid aminotransferase
MVRVACLPEQGMTKLQKPSHVFFRGEIRPWESAVLHISSEAVLRGLNVFEGIKGYWQQDGSFGFVALRRHYSRLCRSARLLHIPFEMDFATFEQVCHALVERLYKPGTNMWVRATLYVTDGHWGEGTEADLVLTAYHTPPSPPVPADVAFSTWQRARDAALPCRIKTSTNYQVARLGKIEGRRIGCSEMILLNDRGRVAEALGSCVLMVRDGSVMTPPPWEGALESITVEIVAELCRSLGTPFERRPVERSELLVADEVGLAGTLSEITLIRSLDGVPASRSPVLEALQARYLAAVTGVEPHAAVDLSCRPFTDGASLAAAE